MRSIGCFNIASHSKCRSRHAPTNHFPTLMSWHGLTASAVGPGSAAISASRADASSLSLLADIFSTSGISRSASLPSLGCCVSSLIVVLLPSLDQSDLLKHESPLAGLTAGRLVVVVKHVRRHDSADAVAKVVDHVHDVR